MFAALPFASFEAWREATRSELASLRAGAPLTLPSRLMRILRNVACFRHPGRWELMRRLARRTLTERRDLIEDVVDADVRHALAMDQAVRRDVHKMHAFVRFREVAASDGTRRYLAWFEPTHEILRSAAPFFVRRFANMQWAIATPDGTASWDGRSLRLLDAPARPGAGAGDAAEELWRTYYRSVCNLARINPQAMRREMPQRYWVNLPEASEIGALVRHGRERLLQHSVTADIEAPAAARALARTVPGGAAGASLQGCQRCTLWRQATQAVAGQGPARAPLMLVGEQPGDEEDLRGAPFVGPAGRVLNELLAEAGLDRAGVYVTNAVKHFKWEPRGKRRLHKRPDASEVAACNRWLQDELESTGARVVVALGATALLALCGRRDSIDASRRRTLHHPGGARVIVTYHPSALLRAEPATVGRLRAALIEDLRTAAALAQSDPERHDPRLDRDTALQRGRTSV
jgi:uracil-DNA glycosylase